MSSDTRMMSSDTGVWEEQQEELRALSPVRRLMRRLNLEALVYESAPFPVLLRKLSALIPACLLWWVIYEPHRLASSTSLPEGAHAITLLPGVWGDPATGAYGGLPELPGVLLRWVLCIAAMVAVVHLCGVKAKGQSFTIPHDARSRLIALMQTLGIFGAFALVVWIEYMMTPLTLMFETVYAGPTAAYSGDGMIPLHLFLSSSLSAIFLGYFCVNILASLNIPGYLGIPAIIYVGALPWAQAERHQFTLALAWVIAVALVSWLVRGMWGTVLACVGYSLWIVLVATSGDPFDLSANMSRVLVILGFPLAFIVAGGGIYRIFYLRQNPNLLRYLQERALYMGEW